MITLADYISPLERTRFGRFAAVLTADGAADAVCAAPADVGCANGYPFTALYRDGVIGQRPYPTEMTIALAGVAGVLRTNLSDALNLVVALYADRELLARMQALPPGADDETILAAFGIDIAATCRASVGAWDPAEYLAPHEGGYAYYLVDINGEVVILSWSPQLAPVVLHLAANRSAEANDLGSRVGKTDPLPLG